LNVQLLAESSVPLAGLISASRFVESEFDSHFNFEESRGNMTADFAEAGHACTVSAVD
jgi:hypothetical protein